MQPCTTSTQIPWKKDNHVPEINAREDSLSQSGLTGLGVWTVTISLWALKTGLFLYVYMVVMIQLQGKQWFLRLRTSSSSSLLVSRCFFDHIFETKKIPFVIRLDTGTETGVLASIHAFLEETTEIWHLKTQCSMEHLQPIELKDGGENSTNDSNHFLIPNFLIC